MNENELIQEASDDVTNELTLNDLLCGQCNLLEQSNTQVAKCKFECEKRGYDINLKPLEDNRFFKTVNCFNIRCYEMMTDKIKELYLNNKGETK